MCQWPEAGCVIVMVAHDLLGLAKEVRGMEIRLGVEVLLNDGSVAGRLEKVVLEPAKGAPSHIVVADGQLPPQGLIVPVGRVMAATQDRVRLAMDRAELEALPEFDPDDFVSLEYGDWPGPYPVSSQPIVAWGRPYPVEGRPLAPPEPPAELPYVAEGTEPQPPGTIALAPGMRVAAFEGQPLGLVERVLTDPETGKATYLVVAGEWKDGANRLVPASWIRGVDGRDIVLVVGPRVVEELASYEV